MVSIFVWVCDLQAVKISVFFPLTAQPVIVIVSGFLMPIDADAIGTNLHLARYTRT